MCCVFYMTFYNLQNSVKLFPKELKMAIQGSVSWPLSGRRPGTNVCTFRYFVQNLYEGLSEIENSIMAAKTWQRLRMSWRHMLRNISQEWTTSSPGAKLVRYD